MHSVAAMSEMLKTHPRTHDCNALRQDDVDAEVTLYGWVQSRRDHGNLIFVDLRDREGLTQIVFDPEHAADAHAAAEKLRSEWCLGIRGKVRGRGQQFSKKENKMVDASNPNLATGAIEVLVSDLEIFSASETPPFAIEDNLDTNEEKRLEYRFLDLRRPELQRSFMTRHRIAQATRRYFDEQRFLEIETPMLVKYTPGGARNFLVPSRLSPGHFYALAESPQLYKQLFMMSGLDRYFQIVKCFRDEDLRGDRQPEFTQIDVEMSFVVEEDVQRMIEGLIQRVFKDTLGLELEAPFQRMTYDEAMDRFGSDKPDLRFGLEHTDLTALVGEHKGGGIPLFEKAIVEDGGMCKAMRLPKEHSLIEGLVKQLGGRGLGRAKVNEGGAWTQSPFAKVVTDEMRLAINEACGAETGDLILFQFGKEKMVHTVLSGLRLHLAERFELTKKLKGADAWKCLWVTDFPIFEHDEDNDVYVTAHHPFTSPQKGHEDKLTSDPGSCRARAYDLVINGNEIGGGSIRIHDSEVQAKVFDALSLTEEEKQAKFGFLLEALKYGTPPHGGIALGLDRLCMILAGASSLRDVIAFPKTQRGTDLLTGAPNKVADSQLDELFIASTPPDADD
jgi:aspartyl-tRNA synthetase